MTYIKGPQGNQGFQGAQGAQGRRGENGDTTIHFVTGPQGAQGPQGASIKGVRGYQGIRGYQGVQGPQGARGVAGSGGVGELNTVSRLLYLGGNYEPMSIDTFKPLSINSLPILGSSPDANFPNWITDNDGGYLTGYNYEITLPFYIGFGSGVGSPKSKSISICSNGSIILSGLGSGIYFSTSGTAIQRWESRTDGKSYYKIRYESDGTGGDIGGGASPDIFEITFFNPEHCNGLTMVELRIGNLSQYTIDNGTFCIKDVLGTILTTYVPSSNTSYVFVGSKDGKTWNTYTNNTVTKSPELYNGGKVLSAFYHDYSTNTTSNLTYDIILKNVNLLSGSPNSRLRGVGCKYCHWNTTSQTTLQGFSDQYGVCPDCGNDITWISEAIIFNTDNHGFIGGARETGQKFDDGYEPVYFTDSSGVEQVYDWIRVYNADANTFWIAVQFHNTLPSSAYTSYFYTYRADMSPNYGIQLLAQVY